MSTIRVPKIVPSPEEDSEKLREAFLNWGSNDALVISILAHRNEKQRKLIQQAYNQKYGVDLLKTGERKLLIDQIRGFYKVPSDLSSFELAVLLCAFDRAERDVFLFRKASAREYDVMSADPQEVPPITDSELLLLTEIYYDEFKRKLLRPLMTLYRYEGPEVDIMLAESQANLLHEKILEKDYTHEKVIEILTTGSRAQLRATLNCYARKFGNSINKDLKANPNDTDLKMLRVCIKCQMYPERHFAKALWLAINIPEIDEERLTNIITSRAEIDLQLIKKEYHRKYGAHLDRDIAEHTSGSHREILLALLGVGNAEELC
ncbi:Annexin repeat [Dillenia turbinata]|uniref:Annexin repeat n=1 Tax=Dillenia turbinata TaxID=194707 RepID=A0AAN8UUK0_9MAGN